MPKDIVWIPSSDYVQNANITQFMTAHAFTSLNDFHRWTVTHFKEFWAAIIKELNIVFKELPQEICDLTQGIESPRWLPGAKLNIVDSCFTAPSHLPAIRYLGNEEQLLTVSYGELRSLVNCIANSLLTHGLKKGDVIAMIMPMTPLAVAIYLAIIKMGSLVVSIADSFSSEEIRVRLALTQPKYIFTQDKIAWVGKTLPLYEKIAPLTASPIVILPLHTPHLKARTQDKHWKEFLSANDQFESVNCDPMQACHVLFSSGTTGQPKAIPWNHTTPMKVGSDAYFHQNIKPGDVLAWPTNLGWMMGPWLVFAALMHQATLALYTDTPKAPAFAQFIEAANVSMLGVVPSLVADWRYTRCMEKVNWEHLKLFSSTGECSNAEDMGYLMRLAGIKPIIEYCGGTEIGGAYISSTVIQKNYPGLFSTPAMGSNFVILNEKGQLSTKGEVALIPPTMGLSTTLLNADHHQIYFADMPTAQGILRRHGDQIMQLDNGYFCILGRTDDTMNLSGIKVSAAEIERAVSGLPSIAEVSAIAVPIHQQGPDQLIIFATTHASLDEKAILHAMQERINKHLNPLFKIHEVVFVDELPKTASNKIMRRLLRDRYQSTHP